MTVEETIAAFDAKAKGQVFAKMLQPWNHQLKPEAAAETAGADAKDLYLRKYLDELGQNTELPAFYRDRIAYAKTELDTWDANRPRTNHVPHLLNALGLRRNEDIVTVREVLDIPAADAERIKQDIVAVSTDQLGAYLDAYILTVGDFNGLMDAVTERLARNSAFSSFESALYIGSFLGMERSDATATVLRQALVLATQEENQLATRHRIVTYFVKRTDDADAKKQALDELLDAIKRTEPRARAVYTAIFDNIFALYLLKQHTPSFVVEAVVNNALALMTTALDAYEYAPDSLAKILRYQSQLSINLTQLLVADERYAEALEVLHHDLSMVEKDAPDYRGEAYGALSYVYYLNGNDDKAAAYGENALAFFADTGAVAAWETVRELLTVIYNRAGDDAKAEAKAALTLKNIL